jgi:hypothetical protein
MVFSLIYRVKVNQEPASAGVDALMLKACISLCIAFSSAA